MAINARQLVFSYSRSKRVLDRVSCSIERGAITAIVGPNGAGKSTLLRLLAGVRAPSSGAVSVDGEELRSITAEQRAARIAYLAQRATLAFDFDVARVIGFGRHASGAGGAEDRALERFAMRELASVPFGTLSVGQQQRVSLARVWAQLDGVENGYLLADEPCASMDPKFAHEAMIALRELADRGIGVGVVLHDLSAACTLADRAIVLDERGKLLSEGDAGGSLDETTLSRVFGVGMRRREVEGLGTVVGVAPTG
ncbi:MAG: ATP-binding cassette domain-containing protein [Phycisphaerales bacterium]|nr:ATP-binding cassette domain-containing protein [Phycisphaerales bacterium]